MTLSPSVCAGGVCQTLIVSSPTWTRTSESNVTTGAAISSTFTFFAHAIASSRNLTSSAFPFFFASSRYAGYSLRIVCGEASIRLRTFSCARITAKGRNPSLPPVWSP